MRTLASDRQQDTLRRRSEPSRNSLKMTYSPKLSPLFVVACKLRYLFPCHFTTPRWADTPAFSLGCGLLRTDGEVIKSANPFAN